MSEQQETEAFVQDLRAAGYGEDEIAAALRRVELDGDRVFETTITTGTGSYTPRKPFAGGRHQKGSAGLEILTSAAHKQSQTERRAHAH